MEIKKTYQNLKPELLFDEVRDLIVKQGAVIDEAKMEYYSLPTDSSSFISRGTLTCKAAGSGKPCIRAHIVGSATGEVKLLLDIDDTLFSPAQVKALEKDLEFIFESYEVKPATPG